MKLQTYLRYFTALTATALLAACGSDNHEPTPAAPVSILATAQATADLSSLVAAVQFASDNNDLVNLLGSAGTLTVFAPTNAAFDKLAQTLTGNANARGPDILVPANKALVKAVLQYHVLTSVVKAAGRRTGEPSMPINVGRCRNK